MKKYLIIRTILATRWLIGLLVILVIFFNWIATSNSTFRLAIYKLILAVMAAIVGHIVIKSLYPYISLSTLLSEDKLDETADSVKFLGAAVLRGAVMAAIILGVLLGV